MSKCPNCSGENADSQHFCGDCGTPLPPGAHQTQSYPESTRNALEQNSELITGALFAKRYQVIEKLGTGGMGHVYRVTDKTLGEEIALKLIRPEIAEEKEPLERFKTELKLAREVVHKNVARMFDFNEEDHVPYITMEYVRGEDLKRLLRKVGHLFAGQAIPIACQICEGLAEAHKLGIVHRDLKPQNIMIDEDGQAKIMDFGLARLLRTGEDKKRHETGGTPAYMSPEQVRGERLDGRSDLYSMGVLLYEMLTGTLPFEGKSVRELAQKHLAEPPIDPCELNPGISAGLSQVVMKCLEKDPEKRFQSAEEVQVALNCLASSVKPPLPPKQPTWLKLAKIAGLMILIGLLGYGIYRLFFYPPSIPPSNTIAILQAADTSPSPEVFGFGHELQDAISTKLLGHPDLTVIPPRDVNSKDTIGKGTKQIGRELGADYLLETSFSLEGSSVSITAGLIDAKRGRQPRTYKFTRTADDLKFIGEEFSQSISTILPSDIVEDRRQKINKGISTNLDARMLYHKGMRLIEEVYRDKPNNEVIEEAVRNYKDALALDPDYALALWALGNAYEARYNSPAAGRNTEDFDMMCGYYQQAFDKNANSSETNIGLGWIHFNKSDFPKALGFFKNAIKLEPRNPIVNVDVGAFLRSIGLYDRAIRYLSRAVELDPRDMATHIQISQCHMAMGRFAKASQETRIVVSHNANDIYARFIHAIQLVLAGKHDDGDKEIAAVRGINPNYEKLPIAEALLAAARGEKDKALALKSESEVLPIEGTCFYLLLGMTEEAIANIEAGIDMGFKLKGDYLYSYPSLAKNPCFKSLRGIPRFQEILKRQKDQYLKELKKFEDL
jgi:serine/threonine-protein kinase